MARPEGFEPPTTWFEARYSIQLSYGRAVAEVYPIEEDVAGGIVLTARRLGIRVYPIERPGVGVALLSKRQEVTSSVVDLSARSNMDSWRE